MSESTGISPSDCCPDWAPPRCGEALVCAIYSVATEKKTVCIDSMPNVAARRKTSDWASVRDFAQLVFIIGISTFVARSWGKRERGG